MEGWIKMHRKLKESSIYKDSELVHLWVHILLTAKYYPCKDDWEGKEIVLQPGQFITGRKRLSSETRISESKTQRALKRFETCGMITQQTCPRKRLITVLNWEGYQQDEQQTNNNRTTIEQQSNTIYKKERKEERKNKNPLPEDDLKSKAFEKWWTTYPKRNGRRVGKKAALKEFTKISKSEWGELKKATINYTAYLESCGTSPKDAERFLKGEAWREYSKDAEITKQDDGSAAAQKKYEETKRILEND